MPDDQEPTWRVSLSRGSGGTMYHIRLTVGDQSWVLSPLEAHKLGSALHVAAAPQLNSTTG